MCQHALNTPIRHNNRTCFIFFQKVLFFILCLGQAFLFMLGFYFAFDEFLSVFCGAGTELKVHTKCKYNQWFKQNNKDGKGRRKRVLCYVNDANWATYITEMQQV